MLLFEPYHNSRVYLQTESLLMRHKEALSWVDRSEEWMEFLALNPRYVLECGCVNESYAKRKLATSRVHYRLINRHSLDETLFRDRQPHLKIDRYLLTIYTPIFLHLQVNY